MNYSGGSIFIIAHYSGLKSDSLKSLIDQVLIFGCKIVVVINVHLKVNSALEVYDEGPICWVKRENTGMNIGAWRAGYELFPDFEYYHFLQSECWVKHDSFLEAYVQMLSSTSQIGLLGESVNTTYGLPYRELACSEHIDNRAFFEMDNYSYNRNYKTKVYKRIELYKFFHSRWGFDSTSFSWRHLRSVNWSARGDLLKDLRFPVGRSKHECIAAEIVVSLMVADLGFCVEQSASSEFSFLGHPDFPRFF